MLPKEIHEDFMETFVKGYPYSTVEKWAGEFKRGRKSVEDDGWSGRRKYVTAYENIKVVHTLVMCGRRRDLAIEVGVSFGVV